jgi:hypothetical protein
VRCKCKFPAYFRASEFLHICVKKIIGSYIHVRNPFFDFLLTCFEGDILVSKKIFFHGFSNCFRLTEKKITICKRNYFTVFPQRQMNSNPVWKAQFSVNVTVFLVVYSTNHSPRNRPAISWSVFNDQDDVQGDPDGAVVLLPLHVQAVVFYPMEVCDIMFMIEYF